MSDFTDSKTSPQGNNPFRPYAEPVGAKASELYDELKDPVGNLRNETRGFAGNPLRFPGAADGNAGLDELDVASLGYDEQTDTAQYARELVRFAGYRYLATLASCPFSMAQTLLQVQYLPAAARQAELGEEKQKQGDADDEDAPDPDDPAYYDYLRARHSERGTQYRSAGRARVDHRGYIVDMGESDIKPGYQLDALPSAKLTVLRKLLMHPTEGFLSLFKGSFTQWVYDMLHLLLQPTLEVVLNEALGVYDNVPLSTYIDASAPSALSVVASNLIVGWLLSPLELVRTRLMVQSASPIHRKYNGTYHALKTIVREEGGLSSLYFSSYHLAPTLLKHTLDPVFRHMGLFALDRGAGIDPYDHPTTFAFGSLVWKTMAATIMLPIDTIRTRLQAQPRYSKKPTAGAAHLSADKSKTKSRSDAFRDFRTCVPLSPVPYTGMANCAWRIVTEEGESLKTMTKRRAVANAGDKGQQVSSAVGHYGLRGLYPGFTLQLAANVAIFGLGFFSANETEFI